MTIHGRLLIAVGLFAAYTSVHASGLQVTPLRLDFSPRQNSGQVEVANLGQAPLAVQIKAFRWTQKDGQDVYEPSADLFFAPPIVNVGAQRKTLVRFRLRTPPPADHEVTYRVYFQEVQPASDQAAGAGMTFRMRFGVPVFVHPAKPAYPALSATTARDPEGLRVVLKNSGQAHVRIEDMQLYTANVDTAKPDQPYIAHAPQSTHGTNYLLPGTTDEWLLPLAAGADPAGLKLLVRTDDYSGHAAAGIAPQGWWWVPTAAGAGAPARP